MCTYGCRGQGNHGIGNLGSADPLWHTFLIYDAHCITALEKVRKHCKHLHVLVWSSGINGSLVDTTAVQDGVRLVACVLTAVVFPKWYASLKRRSRAEARTRSGSVSSVIPRPYDDSEEETRARATPATPWRNVLHLLLICGEFVISYDYCRRQELNQVTI